MEDWLKLNFVCPFMALRLSHIRCTKQGADGAYGWNIDSVRWADIGRRASTLQARPDQSECRRADRRTRRTCILHKPTNLAKSFLSLKEILKSLRCPFACICSARGSFSSSTSRFSCLTCNARTSVAATAQARGTRSISYRGRHPLASLEQLALGDAVCRRAPLVPAGGYAWRLLSRPHDRPTFGRRAAADRHERGHAGGARPAAGLRLAFHSSAQDQAGTWPQRCDPLCRLLLHQKFHRVSPVLVVFQSVPDNVVSADRCSRSLLLAVPTSPLAI